MKNAKKTILAFDEFLQELEESYKTEGFKDDKGMYICQKSKRVRSLLAIILNELDPSKEDGDFVDAFIECVTSGGGAGSISDMAPEHMVGIIGDLGGRTKSKNGLVHDNVTLNDLKNPTDIGKLRRRRR